MIDELRIIVRMALSVSSFTSSVITGTILGACISVTVKFFNPIIEASASQLISVSGITPFDWSVLGIGLVVLSQSVRGFRRISDVKREYLDFIDELIERGELGPEQRKLLYHNLALRLSGSVKLSDLKPVAAEYRAMVEEALKETPANTD